MESKYTVTNLRQLIRDNGYVSIATFMENVIPDYYRIRESIGSDGDFITSPEISQVFGEMLGIWAAVNWQKMGSPQIALAELGPGKGTLMDDLLRGTKNIPNFHNSISVHLVETSIKLRDLQKKTLTKWKNIEINWHNDFSHIPNLPTIVIANEFFDALPIHQYVKIRNQWFENIITTLVSEGDFCISNVPAPKNIEEMLNYEHPNAEHRSIVELSPFSVNVVKKICSHINKTSGIALIIDYGYDYLPHTRIHYNSTLQAIKDHKFHPILNDIGKADITSHVDFFSIKQAAIDSNCKTYGTITQREFLMKTGILIRAEQLIKNASKDEKNILLTGIDRLMSIEQMGILFKVLGISSNNLELNYGFE